MTIHRFFVPQDAIHNQFVTLPADISKQITKVLRLGRGDEIVILDNSGMEYTVKLEQMISNGVSGKIVERVMNQAEPEIKITLFQALLPRDKFEMILQKCTEIGVSKFVPIETKRSLIKKNNFRIEKMDRWERIVKEAAEQSERGIIPEIGEVLTFEEAIDEIITDGEAWIAWEEEIDIQIRNVKLTQKNIGIFIGPEGGFESAEIDFAIKKGAKTFSLGKRILRSETAGMVASSIILSSE